MKTIEQLTITDLNNVTEDKTVSIIVWEEECILSSTYFYKENKQIAPFFDKIKELLSWFDKSKAEIVQSINDKFIGTVQEWVAENNLQDTISEDDFCNSLSLSEIGFCIGDIDDEPLINIYLVCTPDYFLGHAICCYLKKENDEIKCDFVLEG